MICGGTRIERGIEENNKTKKIGKRMNQHLELLGISTTQENLGIYTLIARNQHLDIG